MASKIINEYFFWLFEFLFLQIVFRFFFRSKQFSKSYKFLQEYMLIYYQKYTSCHQNQLNKNNNY